jgi:hypothetical protein
MRTALTMVAWLLAVIHFQQTTAFCFISLRNRIPFLRTQSSKRFLDATNESRLSYVEGDPYDDRMSEIEAMGGDPFFITDDEEDDANEVVEQDTSPSSAFLTNLAATTESMVNPTGERERYATDGKGPTPKASREISLEEWDGTVDENAHLGLD